MEQLVLVEVVGGSLAAAVVLDLVGQETLDIIMVEVDMVLPEMEIYFQHLHQLDILEEEMVHLMVVLQVIMVYLTLAVAAVVDLLEELVDQVSL
jgi:hypothetical protein